LAELKAFAEHARAEAARTGNFDLVDIARLEGAAARAERRPNLNQRREQAGPTLSEYLARREAEATEETEPLSGRQSDDDSGNVGVSERVEEGAGKVMMRRPRRVLKSILPRLASGLRVKRARYGFSPVSTCTCRGLGSVSVG
jgi:hypothetical protein